MSYKKKKGIKKPLIFLLFIFAAAIFFYYFFIPKYICPKDYSEYVEKYAEEYDLEENLVYGIIKAESKFDKDAISHKNAMGLMQLTEGTAEWGAQELDIDNFNIDMLFEPDVNIRIGCWYVAKMIKQYDGNLENALAAYNAGSGNVTKWLNDKEYSDDGVSLKYIPFKETFKYVYKIRIYKKIYDFIY